MSTASEILDQLRRLGVKPQGISADSRRIAAGDLFVALPGVKSDGRAFIGDAIARGAAAVLLESGEQTAGKGNTEPCTSQVLFVPVSGLRVLGGDLAHLIYGRPSEKLWMLGVTGTNGKTSVSQWIASCLGRLGRKCGVIGTLGDGYPGKLRECPNTTPDAISLQRTLAGFVEDGATACAMEVSSIGLDQGRTAVTAFDVAIFTNLTRDHLDYHGSMESYAASKEKLFDVAGLKTAVVNLDDPFGARLCQKMAGKGIRRIGYTLGPALASWATLVDELIATEALRVTGQGIVFDVRSAQATAHVDASLLGRFNASNLLAVLGALLASDVKLEQAAMLVGQLTPPPGRMQIVDSGKNASAPLVVVDYAHTPDALEQALVTLREVAMARGERGGELVCMFGCGGDRDPGKRPMMGEVAQRLADKVIITSDNPRTEEPRSIIAGILRGMNDAVRAPLIEADRADAIRKAILDAHGNDVVLLAGKGHEPYQEIAGQRLPFLDIEHAQAALGAWNTAAEAAA